MVSKRLSRESGHKRKFLAIIDDTPECERAVAYAAQRAKNTNGSLVLLFVIDSSDFQQFFGVGDIMRAEAEETAHNLLAKIADRVRTTQGIEAELIVREGLRADQILKLIDEDQDIAIMVLAAGNGESGPGPLVQSISSRVPLFPIPVTIIPANLTDEDIDAVS